MLLEGIRLGRYHLLRLLGSGGMGEVYLAEDPRIEQQVAIKVIRAGFSSSSNTRSANEVIRLFQREAKAIAMLDHPHISPLFDYGEEIINNITITYIVMPYRKEGSFADWLSQRTDTSLLYPQEIGHFLSQAANAFQHAHDRQIIHQDVKPSNFLIRGKKDDPNHPDLLLTDFGLATFNSLTYSMTYSIRGTPAYMAPEQWNSQPVLATDQYALAIMVYELLTGQSPFQGRLEQVMYQHLYVQPHPPSALNPIISVEIDEVILSALEKKSENRFASVAVFAHAYQEALFNEPTLATKYNEELYSSLEDDSEEITAKGKREPTVSTSSAPEKNLSISNNTIVEDLSRSDIKGAAGSIPPSNFDTHVATAGVVNLPSNEAIAEKNSIPITGALAVNGHSAYLKHYHAMRNRFHSLTRGRKILILGLLLIIVANITISFAVIRNDTASIYDTAIVQANTAATAQMEAIATAVNATITAQANVAIPHPFLFGTLVIDDPFKVNSQSERWDVNSNCQFKTGAYHVTKSISNSFTSCVAEKLDYSNFVYEVQMSIVKGDCGGIIFRSNGPRLYYFRICQNGTYAIVRYLKDISDPKMNPTLYGGSTSLIHPGLNQTNLIAVAAKGSTFDLYVNRPYLFSVNDTTYRHGRIGLIAKEEGNPTEVVFTNAKVWTL
jgi:eukaryotic-like serine/threonine-protein kinase